MLPELNADNVRVVVVWHEVGCDCLIPANPPKEALEKRRRQANQAVQGDHYHTVANPAKGEKPGERGAEPPKSGYRPGRKTQQRRPGKNGP